MRRYWLPQEMIKGDLIHIEGDVFHHIFSVCRQERGSKFEVLGDQNKAHFVEVIESNKKNALCKILETRIIPDLKKPHIHLCLSVAKFPTMDAVIEKAVEMGVHSIRPFFSEYSFIKSELPESRVERWRKIVLSATQQSGRGDLLNILPAVSLAQLFQQKSTATNKLGFFAFEGKSDVDIRTYIAETRKNQKPEEIWLFVGGEGGFSQTEVQTFSQNHLKSVSLGEQVLRVETACITLISVLKYEFELMK